jgi:hypothetical protein
MSTIILKNVRLSYPDIWKPSDPSTDDAGNPIPGKFGAQGIFDGKGSANYELATKALVEVATAKWGANALNVIRALAKDKKCVRNGNDNLDKSGAIRGGYDGKFYIVSRSKARPAIVAHKFLNGKPVIIAEDGSAWQEGHQVNPPFEIKTPYGGCFVNLKVDIYAMEGTGQKARQGKSINATLLAVQFVGDGESFGAAPGTPEGFEDDGSDDTRPTGSDPLFGEDPVAEADLF